PSSSNRSRVSPDGPVKSVVDAVEMRRKLDPQAGQGRSPGGDGPTDSDGPWQEGQRAGTGGPRAGWAWREAANSNHSVTVVQRRWNTQFGVSRSRVGPNGPVASQRPPVSWQNKLCGRPRSFAASGEWKCLKEDAQQSRSAPGSRRGGGRGASATRPRAR